MLVNQMKKPLAVRLRCAAAGVSAAFIVCLALLVCSGPIAFAQAPSAPASDVKDGADAAGDNPVDNRDVGETISTRPLTGRLMEQMMLAEMRASRGDLLESAETYAQLGAITKDSRFLKRAVQWFVQARQFSRAWAVTQSWIAMAPDSPNARTLFDALGLAQGQYAILEANMTIRLQKARALDIKNKNNEALSLAYEQIANALAGAPDKAASYALIERISRGDMQSASARTGRAALFLQRQDFALAFTEIEASLALNPNQARALWVSAQLILSQSETNPDKTKSNAQVLERLDSLINLKQPTIPSRAEALLLKGNVLESQGNVVQAAAIYQQVDAADPQAGFDAQLRFIRLTAKAGQTAKALALVNELNPNSDERAVALLRFKSQLQRDDKDFQGAFATLGKGVEAFADNADLLYEHALMAERIQDFTVMEQQLRRIIESNPRNATALNALGYSFADRSIRLVESEELIRSALTIEPDSAMILDSLGWVLFKQGKFEQAASELKKAFAKDPDPEIAAHLAEALWVLNRKDEAQAVLKSAKLKNANHVVLLETIRRLGAKVSD